MNRQWIYYIGLGVIILNALLLLGILKAIFGVEPDTNLFQTSVTPGLILGIMDGIIAFWIIKKWL
jgi:hypothetical protein